MDGTEIHKNNNDDEEQQQQPPLWLVAMLPDIDTLFFQHKCMSYCNTPYFFYLSPINLFLINP
jgi:hypothetical protein